MFVSLLSKADADFYLLRQFRSFSIFHLFALKSYRRLVDKALVDNIFYGHSEWCSFSFSFLLMKKHAKVCSESDKRSIINHNSLIKLKAKSISILAKIIRRRFQTFCPSCTERCSRRPVMGSIYRRRRHSQLNSLPICHSFIRQT